ncbi:helix-turn-helix domain-containing protein [Streptomyces sp. x-80]|uniref:nSTAND1 domain-containing NTPase n=1 Tax=Streptomyces sp. x-80 TaxID=2789282 RepID=UPI003980D4FF
MEHERRAAGAEFAVPAGGGQLRAARRARGVSLRALSRLVFYSKGYLSKIENGEKPLTGEVARACDRVLGTGGVLERLAAAQERHDRPATGEGAPDAVPDSAPPGRGPDEPPACPYRGPDAYGPEDARVFFGRAEAAAELLTEAARRLAGTGPLLVVGASGSGKTSLLRAGLLPALACGALPVAGSGGWPVAYLCPGEHPWRTLLGALSRTLRAPWPELARAAARGPDHLAAAVAAHVRERGGADGTGHPVSTGHPAGQGRPLDPGHCADPDHSLATGHPLATGDLLATGHPVGAGYEEAVDCPPPRLVLVVDQVEEIFTRCPDDEERDRFLRALDALCPSADRGPATEHGAGGPAALVVLALRSDFHARFLAHPEVAPALRDGHVVPAPMSTAQLRGAIAGPAAAAGVAVGAGLEALLLRDLNPRAHFPDAPGTAVRPGTLPLLSQVLTATWAHRAGGALTVRAYQRAGGAPAALAALAERAYQRLSTEERHAARRLLLHLVQIGQDTAAAGRRVRHRELVDDDRLPRVAATVLEVLVRARLVCVDHDTAEVTHDGVLSSWSRLAHWIDEDGAQLRTRQLLRDAARAWDGDGRSTAMLYGGTRLAAALQWAAGAPPWVSPDSVTRAFLRASEEYEHARQRTERHRVWRSRGLCATATLLAAACLLAGGLAYQIHLTARERRLTAASREYAARADALRARNPRAAVVLALRGLAEARTTEALGSLLGAYARYRDRGLTGLPADTRTLAFAADGRRIAASTGGRVVVLSAPSPGKESRPAPREYQLPADAVGFGPDGQLAAARPVPDGVRIDRAADPRPAPAWTIPRAAAPLSFTPDGRTAVVATATGSAGLWDLATRHRVASVATERGDNSAVGASSDRRLLAVGDRTGTTRLWDTATGRPVATLGGHAGRINAISFTRDGRTVAIAGTDSTIWLWTGDGKRVIAVLTGCPAPVLAMAFTPDGRTLATVGEDHSVRLWDVDGDQVLQDARLLAEAGQWTAP